MDCLQCGYCGTAYVRMPVKSMSSQGLSLAIHASWPGGITNASPGPNSRS